MTSPESRRCIQCPTRITEASKVFLMFIEVPDDPQKKTDIP